MKLTDADKKFIAEHIDPHVNEKINTVSNPFTGESMETTPQITTLVEMIQNLSFNDFHPNALKKWRCTPTNCVSKFDRARMIVLKLDKNVYYKIID